MSRYSNTRVVGTIRSRLLVNAVVDPSEAASRLPQGLSPYVVGGRTVVGCCLLDIVDLRPATFAAMPGMRFRAAAHRISIEWDGGVGVWVPARLTSSCLPRAIGGRAFPGVHRAATTALVDTGDRLWWTVAPRDERDFGVAVTASVDRTARGVDPIGGTCLAAQVGVSPNRRGILESASMTPNTCAAQRVAIDALESEFIDSFASAEPAPSYLMRDVGVAWSAGESSATGVEAA